MKRLSHKSALAALAISCGFFAGQSAFAGAVGGNAFIEFDTSLTSFTLTGGPFLLPLASDPGNALGDSIEGYGFVQSNVLLTLSSQRLVNPGPPTLGHAFAIQGGAEELSVGTEPPPIDPNELHGQEFRVNSFFDVFFDITVTDVDTRAGRNFAGMPNGASIGLLDNGPAHMQNLYSVIFDKNAPNYGLVPPPEVAPYLGHFQLEIPLGGDINGNGIPDKLKFTLATHSVGDEGRTFITLPDGTVIESFDSAAALEGAVVDETSDPPFTIGAIDPDTGLPDPSSFGGPTTASSNLLNPVVPEPTQALLAALGGAAMLVRRRR
jgi:hypothetical protein